MREWRVSLSRALGVGCVASADCLGCPGSAEVRSRSPATCHMVLRVRKVVWVEELVRRERRMERRVDRRARDARATTGDRQPADCDCARASSLSLSLPLILLPCMLPGYSPPPRETLSSRVACPPDSLVLLVSLTPWLMLSLEQLLLTFLHDPRASVEPSSPPSVHSVDDTFLGQQFEFLDRTLCQSPHET